MLWINFLHFYQPVNKEASVIREATEKSFLRVLRGIEEHKDIKFTLNINACLFLRWEEMGYFDIFARLKKLLKAGKIELTGNAAYHPLLPLIPIEECKRQILETESIFKKILGNDFQRKGFFMSEMAYSEPVAILIKSLGYEWIVLDEIAYNGQLNQIDYNKNYFDKASGLQVVFRNRKISNTYVPKTIIKLLEKKSTKTLITASDGELYGLRHEDPTAEFEKVLKEQSLETALLSSFLHVERESEIIKIIPSSWESTEQEIADKKPYLIWQDKDKEIQQRLWKLANFAYQICEEYKNDKNRNWSRWHLVRGLASCTFWWASEKDFKHNFGPFAWSPDEIERGMNELVRVVRSIDNIASREQKIQAEKIYIDLKKIIWEKHWETYWKKK
ncbi:MAG: hypothetical protein US83_C0003G0023 [Candidatus Falkowbacteria bacterium GW2011_GWC2_38_22]|uniref:Glycoside hydrolase family 57 N-terminal domain-containing protein n=1 Tax=Candidatus Falkowbacteria bacterium GW2011_GWE1_38_31 TaxID=1618638 RepID=A0A0G0JUJ1_9BACT|nr:MAG: hypothetical protein US73_C0001G0115 [Candidatus Falkowbacteria bacterium GW2011_GWF2_38_1205]KKQ61774.1 MAG: hypothetical protein US83_C0003G0023 [Candidatus Falkowbacteria bacterium GW2011_GWC2_38_22]KKQ64082.1 MAG: hypothetical protein US84_C0002G0114 [Candidatus Falkowbacteria bacterium GW2011_GWF1_38_22]KKQ66569.1 MAG: hypothetical protein US87_C0001G0090 [Candidatus Falkowbacteria bacterium GW2011_GWE2_38_254]KKQ71188.1 MAG: hypothetical protein US91_C0001G0115 [Candidatus Falkowb